MVHWFPHINASLNALATILLAIGFVMIKKKRIEAHRNMMIASFGVSIVFLVCYLTYHTMRQMQEGVGHTKWEVDGWIRWAYYGILISHVVLAAFVPILAIITIRFAWKKKFESHRAIARITWPIWMYVSVTGVIVYLMLYHLHPALVNAGL